MAERILTQLLSEGLLTGVIASAGYLVARSFMPNFGLFIVSCLSFGIGTALLATLNVILLTFSGHFYPVTSLPLLLLISLLISYKVRKRRRSCFSISQQCLHLLANALIYVFIAMTLCLLSAPILSYDSYMFVRISTSLLNQPDFSLSSFAAYPVFTCILHGVAIALGREYYLSLAPLCSICCLCIGAYILAKAGNGVWRCAIGIFLFLILLLSSFFFVHQSFYLNGHIIFAMYLMMSAIIWFLEPNELAVEEDVSSAYLLLAPVALSSMALLRFEGPLITSCIFALFFSLPRFKRLNFQLVALVSFACPILWYSFLYINRAAGSIVGGTDLLGLIGALFAPFIFSIFSRPLGGRHAIYKMYFYFLVAITILGALYSPEAMALGVVSLISNMVVMSGWGALWLLLPSAFLLSYALDPRDRETNIRFLIATFFLILLVLNVIRAVPFRVGWGDSANRMLVHIAPIVALWLASFASRAEGDTPHQPPTTLKSY